MENSGEDHRNWLALYTLKGLEQVISRLEDEVKEAIEMLIQKLAEVAAFRVELQARHSHSASTVDGKETTPVTADFPDSGRPQRE